MKHIIIFLFLFITTRTHETTVEIKQGSILMRVYDKVAYIAAIDLLFAAKTMWSESRGESEIGRKFVVETIRQRAIWKKKTIAQSCFDGFDGTTTDAFDNVPHIGAIELTRDVLSAKPIHQYKYFLNFATATDTAFISLAKREKAKGKGVEIDNHFFF